MKTWNDALINELRKQLKLPLHAIDFEHFQSTCRKLNSAVTETQCKELFQLFSHPQCDVFFGWIFGNHSLLSLLNEQAVKRVFVDSDGWMKHAFFEQFQQFISPVLLPVLEQQTDRKVVLSYCKLLTSAASDTLQKKIATAIKAELEEFTNASQQSKSDQELHHACLRFLNSDLIETLNSFDEHNYQLKRSILDTFVALFEHSKTSTRLMNVVVNQLLKIDFTPEHQAQLKTLQLQLKSGKVRVERQKISWKKLSFLLLGACLLVAGIIALYVVEPTTPEVLEQEQTAFMAFSPQERARMDSLIALTQKKQVQQQGIDSDIPFVGEELVKQDEINNYRLEALIEKWMQSDTTAYTLKFGKINSSVKPYVGSSALKTKKGSKTVEFHNASQLVVLILVVSEQSPKTFYSAYVKPAEVMKWKAETGDYFFVLPGNQVPNQLNYGDLPFEERSNQFYAALKKWYVQGETNSSTVKLIWKEEQGVHFLVDISLSVQTVY